MTPPKTRDDNWVIDHDGTPVDEWLPELDVFESFPEDVTDLEEKSE